MPTVLEFKDTAINGRSMLFGLISRRNRFRAGTRYFSRGIDREGNVSNFNETEQVVLLDAQSEKSGLGARGDIRFSYVQTRGSVPVYWAEINNLRYKPDLKVMDLSSTVRYLCLACAPLAAELTLSCTRRPNRCNVTLTRKSRNTATNTWSTSSTSRGTRSPSRRRTSAPWTPWPTRACITPTLISITSVKG